MKYLSIYRIFESVIDDITDIEMMISELNDSNGFNSYADRVSIENDYYQILVVIKKSESSEFVKPKFKWVEVESTINQIEDSLIDKYKIDHIEIEFQSIWSKVLNKSILCGVEVSFKSIDLVNSDKLLDIDKSYIKQVKLFLNLK